VVNAALHCESKGIFHRDIKDENILLDTKTGQVKLFDFGSGTILENTLYTDYEGIYKYVYIYSKYTYSNIPVTTATLLLIDHNCNAMKKVLG
jgi:serine/threonine protein kinase